MRVSVIPLYPLNIELLVSRKAKGETVFEDW